MILSFSVYEHSIFLNLLRSFMFLNKFLWFLNNHLMNLLLNLFLSGTLKITYLILLLEVYRYGIDFFILILYLESLL